jgi:hypothetical protein
MVATSVITKEKPTGGKIFKCRRNYIIHGIKL